MDTRLAARLILGQLLSLAAAAAAMFWPAGRLDWPPAWAVMAVWLVWFAALDSVLLRRPDLLAERLAPPKGARGWDQALLSLIRLVELARYVLAGLDQRHGWTGGFSLAAQAAALPVCLLSAALFAWAAASNPFFSQVVRIQADRGHAVAAGGPYRFVRHPAYLAAILLDLALSVLLASWPAVAAGALCAVLFVLRTALEDRDLRAGLPGYADYARRVRYRLAPGIW